MNISVVAVVVPEMFTWAPADRVTIASLLRE